MTVLLSDHDLRAGFDWRAAVDALRAAYGAETDDARFPPRTMARGNGVWLRALTGIAVDDGLMGAKLIAASVRGRAVSYLIPLFDQDTAELRAVLDGNAITGFRTAATSALAADVLTADRPLRVAVIGSGFEAQHHVRALHAIRRLDQVSVFSPTPQSRSRFVDNLRGLDVPMVDAESAPAALEGADLVICAARARQEKPTLHGEWLRPGMTVVSIGSTLPEQREVDTDTLARADLIVADQVEEVSEQTGDLLAARDAGVAFDAKLVALADVVAARVPGRTDPEQIVVYKSVGASVQDLTVAALCYRRATDLGLGTTLPLLVEAVRK